LHNGFRELIEVTPRPAGVLLWFVVALAAGAGLSIVTADIAAAWKCAAVPAIVAFAAREFRRWADPRGSRHVARAVLLADGSWSLLRSGSEVLQARLEHAWGVRSGPVIALEWRCHDGRRYQAWLLKRDVAPFTWRRLRVRLSLS